MRLCVGIVRDVDMDLTLMRAFSLVPYLNYSKTFNVNVCLRLLEFWLWQQHCAGDCVIVRPTS